MKIGFDAKRLYNNFTGLGNHSRTTIDILTQYFPDNDYILFTPKVKKDPIVLPYLNKEHCKTVLPLGFPDGSLWRTFSLNKECNKAEIDIFHGLSNEIPVGLDIPSVVTIHDVAFKTFPQMYHPQDRFIYNLKWKYACQHATKIIAISECTKRDIMEFYGVDESKIHVIYQPVNPRYYKELPERKKTLQEYMLYVGSINSRKNLLGIVKAIEGLSKESCPPLVVVGSGREYKREVLEYIHSHHMDDRFIFKENLNQEQLQQLYLGATMFIFPSFYEGFGLPVVEALLCECPVITSNVSCLPEAGGPYSLLVDPQSPDDIRFQIERLLQSEDERKERGEKGRKWALENFHPQVLSQQLINIYENTVG